MLSFVVQNFLNPNPFLIKTQRFNNLIKLLNTKTIFFFSKLTMHFFIFSQNISQLNPYLYFFYDKQYIQFFWHYFKKIFSKNLTLITSNALKSYLYSTIVNFDKLLTGPLTCSLVTVKSSTSLVYFEPVQTISFAFHKKLYNTLMFYIFNVLTTQYFSTQSTFQIFYSFIHLPSNFNMYMFLNFFYFKIRNN